MSEIIYKNFRIVINQYCYDLYFQQHYKTEKEVKDGSYKNFDDVLRRIIHIGLYLKNNDKFTLFNYIMRIEKEMKHLRTEIKIPINYD